jgi:DNA-binding NarL/FixJ family response regulator
MRVAVFTSSKAVANDIKTKLAKDARICMVGAANNHRRILEIANETNPNLIIIEIRNLCRPAPNELIRLVGELRAISKNTEFISLTNYGNIHRDSFSRNLSIKGFCLYTIHSDDLIKAVHKVANGRPYMQKEYASALKIKTYLKKHYELRERHVDVLTLMLLGHSNEEIAGFLHISYDTVKSHVKAILDRFGARDRAEAISIVYIDVLSKINKSFAFLVSFAIGMQLVSLVAKATAEYCVSLVLV